MNINFDKLFKDSKYKSNTLPLKTQKIAIIICGIPASGKSTLRNKIINDTKLNNYIIIDPDLFLSYFNNNYEITAQTTKKIIEPFVFKSNHNIIFDKVCSYIKDIDKLINTLKQEKYFIQFHMLFTDLNLAIQRNINRKRTINLDIISNKYNEIMANKFKYLELKPNELYIYYNNILNFIIYN
jgi:predicted ABC-type ATPase